MPAPRSRVSSGPYKVREVAYHRNGICGEGFHVVTFADTVNRKPAGPGRSEPRELVAVVFDVARDTNGKPTERGNGRVAVFERPLLAEGVIAFGQNSWRGDHYEIFLREEIAAWQKREGH